MISFVIQGYIKDIETLMKISDEETLVRIDEDIFDDTTDQRLTRQ